MVKTAHRNVTLNVIIGFSVSPFKRPFEKAVAYVLRAEKGKSNYLESHGPNKQK